jgi:retron-type reverse transcriptase
VNATARTAVQTRFTALLHHRRFFNSVDHGWLLRMLAHRIADPQVLRLVRMWLDAGILERAAWHETDRGTPQEAGITSRKSGKSGSTT